MAIAHQSTATTTFGTSTAAGSRAVNLPASLAAGDIILVQATVASAVTVSTPAGWSLAAPAVLVDTYLRSYVWWRAATGSEGSTQAFVQAGSGFSLWAASRYSGVDTASPFAGHDVASGAGFDGLAVCPAVTSTADDAMVVRFASVSGFGTPPTPGAHTSRASLAVSSYFLAVATMNALVDEGESSGPATYTAGTFLGGWANRTILLAPLVEASTEYDETGLEVAAVADVAATDVLSGAEHGGVEAAASLAHRALVVPGPAAFRLRRSDRGSALRAQHTLRYGRHPVDLDETGAGISAVATVACSDGVPREDPLAFDVEATAVVVDSLASLEPVSLAAEAEVTAAAPVTRGVSALTGFDAIVTVADDLLLGESVEVEATATLVSGGGMVREDSPVVEVEATVEASDAVGLSAEHAVVPAAATLAAGTVQAAVEPLSATVAATVGASDGRRWAEARTVAAVVAGAGSGVASFRSSPVAEAAVAVAAVEVAANAYAEHPVAEGVVTVTTSHGYRWAEHAELAVVATVSLAGGRAWAEQRAVIIGSATTARGFLAVAEHGQAVVAISAVAAVVGFPFAELGHVVEAVSTVDAGDDQGRTSIERLVVLVAGTVSGSDTPAAVEHRGITVVSRTAGRSAREGRVRAAVHVIATVSTAGPPGALVGQRVKVLVTRRYRRVRVLTHEPQG